MMWGYRYSPPVSFLATIILIILITTSTVKSRFITDDKKASKERFCVTPVVEHGDVTIRDLSSVPIIVPPGTRIIVRCLDGYTFGRHVEPLQVRICTNDGIWSSIDGMDQSETIAKCLSIAPTTTTTTEATTTETVVTCPVNLIDNGALLAYTGYRRVMELTENNAQLFPGNRIRVICDPGFVLTEGSEFSFCLTDGSWSTSLGSCVSLKLESQHNQKPYAAHLMKVGAEMTSIGVTEPDRYQNGTITEEHQTTENVTTSTTPELETTIFNETTKFFTITDYESAGTKAGSTKTKSLPMMSPTTPDDDFYSHFSEAFFTTLSPMEFESVADVDFKTTAWDVSSTSLKTSKIKLNLTTLPVPIVAAVHENVVDVKEVAKASQEDDVVLLDCSTDLPALTNGVIGGGGSGVKAGSIRKVICNLGFTLFGSPNVTCNVQGQWEVNALCAQACLSFPDIEHAKIEILGMNHIGAERKFHCNLGYVLNGSNVIRCEEDGTWSVRGSCGKPIEKLVPLKRTNEFSIVYMDENIDNFIPQKALNITTLAFRYGLTIFDRVKFISERFNELYGNYWGTIVGPASTAISGKYVSPNYIHLRREADFDVIVLKETCSKTKPHLSLAPTSRPLDTSKFYFLSNTHANLANATKTDALNFVTLAFKLFGSYDEIANFVQNQFNLAFGGDWFCVVGPSNFDVYYWYEQPLFISIGKVDDNVSVSIIHPPICP